MLKISPTCSLAVFQINGKERVPIRCVLHHQGKDPEENARLRTVGWQHRFHEPVLERQRHFLARMKRHQYGREAAKREDNNQDLERFRRWKKDRSVRNSCSRR